MDKAARAALLTAKGIKKYARGGSAPSKTPVKNPMLQEVYFAGPNAKTFNQVPEERKFKDPTGMQRFEGSDDQASSPIKTMSDYYALLRQPGPRMEGDRAATLSGTTVPLGSLLSHEEMYRDYPQLKETPVFVKPPSGNGRVASYSDAAALASNKVRSNMTNEIINPNASTGKYNINNEQDMESVYNNVFNSPNGAFTIDNPDSPHFTPTYLQSDEINPNNNFSDKFLRMLVHESQHAMNSIDKTNKYGSTPENYERRPTEMEAFFTAHRLNMTPEQRAVDAPYMPMFFRQTARYAAGGPVNSTGATLDLARAVMAKERAGGQIAPSKYLPGVPRQVHADGGKVAFMQGNHPLVPDVLYHGSLPKIATKGWTDEVDEEQTQKNRDAQDFRTFRPSEYGNYGPGIYLTDNPKTASDYAQGIRADQSEAKPHGQVMKLHVSMKQPFTDDVLRHPAWIDYIKGALTKYHLPYDEDRAARDAIISKLDDGTATVRDMFVRDTPHGTMVNQHGQDDVIKTIRNSGFDGIIAHRPDGSKEIVAFKPEQIKSAIGNQGTFDPNDPDITKAGGGKVSFLSGNHPAVPDVVYHGTDQDFRSFNRSKIGSGELGFHFGNKDASNVFADKGVSGSIIPAHINLKNPIRLEDYGDWRPQTLVHQLSGMGKITNEDAKNLSRSYTGASSPEDANLHFIGVLKKLGHDGIVYTNRAEGLSAKDVDYMHENNLQNEVHNLSGDEFRKHFPSASDSFIVFHPEQIKSAIGNQGTFDPTNPDMTKSEGGPVTGSENGMMGDNGGPPLSDPPIDLGAAREQKQVLGFHKGLMGDIASAASERMEAHQKAVDAGVFDGYEVGDTLQGSAHPMRITGRFVRPWKPSRMTLEHFDRMGAKPTVVEHNGKQYIPMLRYQTGKEGVDGFQEGDVYLDGVKASGYQKMGGLRSVKADGGKVDPNQKHMNRGTGGRTVNKMNMYSKAAEVARSLPQAKGSVDQMLAMLRKGGVKPAELEHAGRPAGDMIDRETLAKHFEDALPKVSARQYGEQPYSMTQDENQEYNRLMNRNHASRYRTGAARAEPLSPEEMKRFEDLGSRMRRKDPVSVVGEGEDGGPAETGYHDYQTPGGKDYRERLLTLPKRKGTPSWTVSGPSIINPREHDTKEAADADAAQMNSRLSPDIHPSRRHRVSETTRKSTDNYQSSHWRGDDNVLAHIRMKDVPVDGRRALHIEEIQSDWAQEGRKQGFYDPKNPYEIFKTTTGETVSKHPSQDAMWDAYRAIPEDQAAGLDYGHASHTSAKKPNAPYVKNTAHWTDLALKNILAEAAHGRYDHVTFTGGQEQADRYGLEKSLSAIHYTPETKTLHAERIGQHRPIIQQDVAPEQVASYIGSEAANKLLDPSNAYEVGGVRRHSLVDDDLKMGGEGMKGYYDNILPKAAMKLVQQHDPSIQPSTINGNFGFTMTPKARESILQGQPAFAKGGEVDNNNQGDDQYGKTAPLNSAPRPQAGEFPVSGGVRGGSGVLQAPYETSLEGLPQKVSIPLTGGSVSAGHDPRIRQIARDYMASTGMPYNPPTKYAKVDPKRASRIAAAYDDMKDDASDPLTKASYDAMIKETMAQYRAAKNAGFKAEFWNPETDEDPYKASPRLATEDVRNNHHMWVYPTRSGYGSDGPITAKELAENPLLQDSGETWNGQPVTVNDIFRAVHDYYGHAKEGVGFRGDGEENAWRSHASMYSPLARMAMTSETRGQNSWLNYGVHGDKNRNARTEDTIFAPQKIGVLPHWAHHEGAEDFMRPEDVKAMAEIHKRYGRATGGAVNKALDLTRGFTKNGAGVMMSLKSKGK